jgi:hypothetical protein
LFAVLFICQWWLAVGKLLLVRAQCAAAAAVAIAAAHEVSVKASQPITVGRMGRHQRRRSTNFELNALIMGGGLTARKGTSGLDSAEYKHLIEEVVLARARSIKPAPLPPALHSGPVIEVLTQRMWALKAIFTHYADSPRASTTTSSTTGAISLKAFLSMLGHFDLSVSASAKYWSRVAITSAFEAVFMYEKGEQYKKKPGGPPDLLVQGAPPQKKKRKITASERLTAERERLGRRLTFAEMDAEGKVPKNVLGTLKVGFAGFVEAVCRCALIRADEGKHATKKGTEKIERMRKMQVFAGCKKKTRKDVERVLSEYPWNIQPPTSADDMTAEQLFSRWNLPADTVRQEDEDTVNTFNCPASPFAPTQSMRWSPGTSPTNTLSLSRPGTMQSQRRPGPGMMSPQAMLAPHLSRPSTMETLYGSTAGSTAAWVPMDYPTDYLGRIIPQPPSTQRSTRSFSSRERERAKGLTDMITLKGGMGAGSEGTGRAGRRRCRQGTGTKGRVVSTPGTKEALKGPSTLLLEQHRVRNHAVHLIAIEKVAKGKQDEERAKEKVLRMKKKVFIDPRKAPRVSDNDSSDDDEDDDLAIARKLRSRGKVRPGVFMSSVFY